MLRLNWSNTAILALLAAAGSASAQAPANGDWKLDAVQLKSGRTFHGLVVEETPAEVRFQIVKRMPGRPTVTLLDSFPRADVKRLDKLAGKEREELVSRLQALDPAGHVEDPRLKGIDLRQPPFFIGAKRKEALGYSSDHFELVSDANEDIVRRAALRLEQTYAAFTHYFPPVGRPNTSTIIVLIQSAAEYHDMLNNQGRDVFNPAFYDVANNTIFCTADSQKLGKQLGELKRSYEELHERIKKQEVEAARLPKGEVQNRAKEQLQQAGKALLEVSRQNEELLRKATQVLFRGLYHEAFHAYLANFVFPSARGEVPRWLNEGLAQVFEEAIVEGGQLRLGNVEPARLEMAQAAVKKGELVPLADLLRSGPGQFVVAHGQERQAADRHYLTSWALAHYLMFARRLTGPALEEYLTALNGKLDPRTAKRERGVDPLEALAKLADRPLPQLEKELQEYILTLRTDGTTRK
jgi:hypothetical protein